MQTSTQNGTEDQISIRLPSGFIIRHDAIPTVDMESTAAIHFQNAVQIVHEFQVAQSEVVGDGHLSQEGKRAKIEPLAMMAIAEVARCWAGLSIEERHFNSRLTKLYAVPTPKDGLENDRQREMREWWARQSMGTCTKLIERMAQGPELAGLELAILSGPLAGIDPLLDAVRSSWQQGCRVNNPAEFGAISAGLKTVSWARRGAVQAGVALLGSFDRALTPSKLLEKVLATDGREAVRQGFGVFGLSAADVAEVLRRREAGHPVH